MSKHSEHQLVPRLRFPEFVESGVWVEKKLGNIGNFTGGGTPSKDDESFWQGEIPWVSSSDIEDESIFSVKISRYISQEAISASATKLVPSNSILLVSRVGVGKLAITLSPICTSQDFTNFTPNNDNLIFLAYYLKKHKETLLSFSQGMAIKGFTKDDVFNLRLQLPSLEEQQKIATCLSSLDALVTAERQKLEALKAHKKGLLQQLFPQEGEKAPRFRFKEFEGDGDWVERRLGEVAEITSGGPPNRSNSEFWNGDIPWVATTLIDFNIISSVNEYITEFGLQNSSAKIFPKNTILMAMYGQGKTRGKVATLGIEAATNQACAALLLNDEYNTKFVFQNLASRYDEIRKLSNQGGQDNLSAGLIENIPIVIPINPYEQQKIAATLSSIDDLVSAQQQKIEALQMHKKGLLQGLFPDLNEATA